MKLPHINPTLAALLGFAAVLAFYFGLLSLLNSPGHAWTQFRDDYWWILAFAIGMATQAWILATIHASAAIAGASAGSSGAAMALCCVHHVADFAPLAGAAFAAGLVYEYQPAFIALGLLANAVGIMRLMDSASKCSHTAVPFAKALDWSAAWKLTLFAGAGLTVGVAAGVMFS
ncbi:hypothetical protein AUJ14_02065 [Candidatus Micrarchaeota archaeon CG1_02_55_22]|nr:MAG: hypothetical protein AUJ14_02065 [Candidatus Micrarchaeota archaeon CG1_02_55_22]